jgi:hypothetical protein
MQTLCKQTAKQTNAQQPSLRDAKQTPPSLRGAKRRSSLGLKLTQKLQTLFKLLLLSITLTTTLVAQDMYRPPYESTLNIEPRAKQWYRDAALDSDAAFNIAVTYDEDLNDLNKAKLWYHYAWSLKDDKDIAVNLGATYEDLKEYEKAKQWYEKAVERESKDGMFNLALLYKNHYNEYHKAIELYEKSHEMGHYGAASNLGLLYATTLKDYDNAKVWYQKAIDNNDSIGIKNMAWLYHELGDNITATAYMINMLEYEDVTLKQLIDYIKDRWGVDDQTIQKGYELQLTMDNLPKKYRGGVR